MFGNNGKIDFDTIARNMFGANADKYKEMAQSMQPNQMNELMMKFQALPPEKKQQFMNEIQQEVNKIKQNNGNNINNGITGVPNITKIRF